MQSFQLWLAAAHLVGDYVAQNDWMAANKFKSWRARTIHVAAYTLCFLPVVFLAGMAPLRAVSFLAGVFVPHWLVDCRRWAKGDKWPPKPILVDQAIHAVCLAVLASAFHL